MPKRRGEKTRKGRFQTVKRRRIRVISSDSSEIEINPDTNSNAAVNGMDSSEDEYFSEKDETTGTIVPMAPFHTPTQTSTLEAAIDSQDATPLAADVIPELPPEVLTKQVLLALGDSVDNIPDYGEDIHPNLAQRWLPILRKGLEKDAKVKLMSEYKIPSNCTLLKAPTINPEISIAITESLRARDTNLETAQNQLGLGITAINKAMTLLLTGDDKLQAIKILSESCRILTDLHYVRTEHRIKLLTPSLDKSFINLMENEERDNTLFGKGLNEKIKTAKAIEKQGLLIKKNVPVTSKPSASTSRGRGQGNWSVPSHFPSNKRGGRGGYRSSTMTTSQLAPRRAPAQAPPQRLPAAGSYRASAAISSRYQHRAPRRH